jgi:hypothetical protein
MGQLSRLLAAPRYTLLGFGILAFTLSNWLAFAVQDGANPLATLVMLGLLALGLALILTAVVARSAPPAGDGHVADPPASTGADVVRGKVAAWPRVFALALPGASSDPPPGGFAKFRRLGALALSVLLVLSTCLTCLLAAYLLIASSGSPRSYDSDAAAFNHYNAELVLQGENPYTADARFWDALRRFPSTGATPLRAGRYAASQFGPTLPQLVRDVQAEIADPSLRGPELDPASMHSYPALAFLIYVPGVWAGLPTTMLTSLLLLVAFLLAAVWGAARALWIPVVVLLLADSLLVILTLRGSFDLIALLPALVAWRLLERRWLSPLLLGIACAVKQLVWPLVPFYVVIVWRREGVRAALARLPFILAGFLAPNLPFLLTSPRVWATSLLLPVTLPIFPSGTGVVALARSGLMPLLPPAAYALATLLALAALLMWFARARTMPPPDAALIVALLPYLLAWHSLMAYVVAIPALAIFACLRLDVATRANIQIGGAEGRGAEQR